jgi:2-dehydropantoate 2-reductase
MRFVIYGAGAVGGVVGACLHRVGYEVVLIARGAHYEAIAKNGLTLETPSERSSFRIAVIRNPGELAFADGDVVILTMKGQDTEGALEALADAAPRTTPVVCAQNGVENERLALRRFQHTYGALIISPTAHFNPGVVAAYGAQSPGAIDVGRYPSGVDDRCREICDALEAAGFSSFPRQEIMRFKHAKLISNLANSIQVVCGPESESDELVARVEEEGRTVLTAAGIPFALDEDEGRDARVTQLAVAKIPGRPRGGGSSWQSAVRGTGSVESEFLNGEIVLRARQIGIEAPVNALLAELARETVRDGRSPGWLSPAEVLARV